MARQRTRKAVPESCEVIKHKMLVEYEAQKKALKAKAKAKKARA
jgi:hypothetical protein